MKREKKEREREDMDQKEFLLVCLLALRSRNGNQIVGLTLRSERPFAFRLYLKEKNLDIELNFESNPVK